MNQLLAILAVLIVACSSVYGQEKSVRETDPPTNSRPSKFSPLQISGYVSNITISPDGKYAAYVTKAGSKKSIRRRQITTNREIEIVPPTEDSLDDLSFSPDSNYLYYVSYTRSASVIFRVRSVGGSSTRIVENIEKDTSVTSAAAVSPDGKTIVFQRDNDDASFLQLANADGTNERTVIKFPAAAGIASKNLAWSPDGKTVAYGSGRREKDGLHIKLLGINVSGGPPRQLNDEDWSEFNDVIWLPNGNFIVSGKLRSDKDYERSQLRLLVPNAPPQLLTNERYGYWRVSATAKGDKLLSWRIKTPFDFWITTKDVSDAKQVTTSGDIFGRVRWVPGGRLAFSSTLKGERDIWTMNSNGADRKQLTADQGTNLLSSISADGRFIFFIRTVLRNKVEISSIWRMNSDGSDQRQLTNGPNDRSPRLSPDGGSLYYLEVTGGDWNICKMPIDGGAPFKIASKKMSSAIDVSPRTGMIAYINDDDWRRGGLAKLVIISSDDKPIKTLLLPRTAQLAHFQWTPDETAISFQDSRDGGANVWVIPFSGNGETKRLSDLTSEVIVDYDLSPDGKQILAVRATTNPEAVLIRWPR